MVPESVFVVVQVSCAVIHESLRDQSIYPERYSHGQAYNPVVSVGIGGGARGEAETRGVARYRRFNFHRFHPVACYNERPL